MYIDAFSSQGKIFDQVSQGSRVLEIGCGSGRLSNQLSIWKQCKVYCVDKDPAISRLAKGKWTMESGIMAYRRDMNYPS